MAICAAFLPFRLAYGYSLKLLFPLFPRIPRLSVVEYVVKNRFLNTLVTWARKRFSQSIGAPQAAIWQSGLAYCTSAGEVKQVLYAGIGGAEFASL